MNSIIICGRLTKDPEIRDGEIKVAKYTLAVDRRRRRDQSDPNEKADFINCVAFDNGAKFAEKYLKQGTKILVRGHLQTGSYKNQNGQTVYTTDVIVEESEFAQSKPTDDISPERMPFQ